MSDAPREEPVVKETLAEKLGTAPPAAPSKGTSGATVFLQFVVFPLLVVLVAVAILGFFQGAGQDRRSYGEYLDEISTGWTQRRPKAAYELLFRLSDKQDELSRTADVPRTIAVFVAAKKQDDPGVRRCLAVVL